MNYDDQIKSLISSNKVMVFMKGTKDQPQCGFSNAVVQVFTQLGVPFETHNVLADRAFFEALKKYSDWPTSPQVYLNGELVGGCDIVMEMYQSGELAPMVEKALQ